MKMKMNPKLSLIAVLTLAGFFFSSFSPAGRVAAQTEPKPPPEPFLIMDTLGYSAISLSSYNFFGSYFMENYPWRRNTGVTVYFQYKKVSNNFILSSDLALDLIFGESDVKKTVEVKYNPGDFLDATVDKWEDFIINAELQSFSRYIFRAVGQFNDDPNTKFYGNTLLLSTGVIPLGFQYPYTVDKNNNVKSYVPPPTVTISAVPEIVPYGGSVMISWTSTNATSCYGYTFTDDWTRQTSISGSERLFNLEYGYRVFIKCTGPGGSVKSSTVFTVKDKPKDGGWSIDFDKEPEKGWIKCSPECGEKCIETRTRECNNPRPEPGGKYCTGPSVEIRYNIGEKCKDIPAEATSKGGESGPFGLVPCGNEGQEECGFNHILKLVDTLTGFLFKTLVIPLAAVMFAYAGVVLVISGGSSDKRGKAKKIFFNVALGLVIAAGAFVIVQAILEVLGVDRSGGWNWFGF